MQFSIAYPFNSSSLRRVTVAYGQVNSSSEIDGRLTWGRRGRKKLSPVESKISLDGKTWFLVFFGMERGRRYTLEVNDGTGLIQRRTGLQLGRGGVGIFQPTGGMFVDQNFGAMGDTSIIDTSKKISVLEVKNGNHTVSGNLIYDQVQGSARYWGATFENVPPSTDGGLYTLTVAHGGNLGAKSEFPITVIDSGAVIGPGPGPTPTPIDN